MKIRKAEYKDIVSITENEMESFSIPLKDHDIENYIDNPVYTVLIAEDETGYSGHSIFYTIEEETEIISVAVLSSKRRQNTGYHLMMETEIVSKASGSEKILLEVRQSNVSAIALYEKCGFKKAAVRKNFYDKPSEDGITMMKRYKADSGALEK